MCQGVGTLRHHREYLSSCAEPCHSHSSGEWRCGNRTAVAAAAEASRRDARRATRDANEQRPRSASFPPLDAGAQAAGRVVTVRERHMVKGGCMDELPVS